MPLHYPPLANGTYRYGDQPQPLPSPLPGPDPAGQSAYGPPPRWPLQTEFAAHPPQLDPLPANQTRQSRSGGMAAAVAVFGVLGLVVVGILALTIFGSGTNRTSASLTNPTDRPFSLSPDSTSFNVDGSFTVASSPGEPVSGDTYGCVLPYALSDIDDGTPIRLYTADLNQLDNTVLTFRQGDSTSCTFTFAFLDVPSGEPLYLLEIPGRGQLTYTEIELREGVDITLGR